MAVTDTEGSCTFLLGFVLGFPHNYSKLMDLGKKDHRGKVPISSHHIMATFFVTDSDHGHLSGFTTVNLLSLTIPIQIHLEKVTVCTYT